MGLPRSAVLRRAMSPRWLVGVVGAVVGIGLAACGGSSTGPTSTSNGSGPSFSLRLSSDVPTTSAAGIDDALFAKEIGELTAGKVKVTVYPLSQLGAESTVLSGVQTGSIDMADLYTGSVSGQLPTLGLYSLPFLVRSEAGAAALLNSGATQEILNSLGSKGIKGIYVASNGPFELLANKAVDSPVAFSGMKLRINTDPISTAMLKEVNATAVPLPSLQVYSALQQGLVSGGITAPAGMVALKWYEVARYLTDISPQWDMQATVMSPATWNRVPAAYRTDIMRAAALVMQDNKTTAVSATQSNLNKLKADGVTFATPDTAPFRDVESRIYNQFAASIGQSLISAAEQVEQKY